MPKAKGADKEFLQETKRLDAIRKRKIRIPILIGIVVLIAFSFTPWAGGPRNVVNATIGFVHSLVTGGEVEPDAVYW